jgi:hypothetical protein
MFKKQEPAKDFRKLWFCEPRIGHQVSFGKLLIEIKSINDDTLFWEEVSFNAYEEVNTPTMIKDKALRKAFIREHVVPKKII